MTAPAVAGMLGEPVDLLALDTSSPRPWTVGAHRITRPGLRTIRFGARGSGKSIAELILAVQVCEAGGTVLYADWENGSRRTAERLTAILADRPAETRTAVAERFDYRPNPRLGKLGNTAAVDEWAALFAGRDLAVIDSTARALAQLGLDENAATDFARFMSAYVDPIAAQGVAVDLLDNTGWGESDRTRGTSAKLDMCELAYKVTSTPIAPDTAGTITLDRVRSRDGDEAPQLVAHVGAGTYSTLHPPDADERETALADTLIEHIREHPGEPTEAIAKALHLRPSRVRDGLAILEATGTAYRNPSQTRDGIGRVRTRQGWFTAPPSQLQAVPTDRTDKDGNTPTATSRPTVPPLKGGTGTAPGQKQATQNGHNDGWTIEDAEAIAAEFTETTP